MLDFLPLTFILYSCCSIASPIPADPGSSKENRAIQSGDLPLSLPHDETASSATRPNTTTHRLTQEHEPYCFMDAWIPLINPEDCLHTEWEISIDEKPPSITQPITLTKMRRWIVRSCAYVVVPNAPKPRDTFSKMDILGQAHRVKDKCEKSPYGFRGGFVEIGNGNFQVMIKRPTGHIASDYVVEL